MNKCLFVFLTLASCGCAHMERGPAAESRMTDGRTFAGWDGDLVRTWRIEDGAFVGGSLTERVPRNEFLASTERYTNFVLRLQFRLLGTNGMINAGVQIRSERIDNPANEMRGYQCDLGAGYWGALYDESRRNRVLAQPDPADVQRAMRMGDWNEYLIRAEGPRIRSWINGVAMIDYVEPDPAIPQHGRIGLQVHGGGAAQASYKDVRIERLP